MMLDINILRDERESGFNNWFDNWWASADIENKIVDRNAAGYAWLSLQLTDLKDSDYKFNRFKDSLFTERLKAKLPGFKIDVRCDAINRLSLRISWDDDGERVQF